MEKEYRFVHNEGQKQFEIHIDGFVSKIEYTLSNDNVYSLTHTKVPTELEGQGVGKALVERTLLYIQQQDGKVLPFCPFISVYIKRHPEWAGLVAL